MDGNCDFIEMSEKEKVLLKQFRSRVEDIFSNVGDYYLYRFLKARSFSLNKAEHMIREHYKFRQLATPDTILEEYKMPEVMKKYFSQYFIGCDKEGDAVLAMHLGRTDLRGVVASYHRREHTKCLSYLMELMIREMKKNNEKNGRYNRRLVFIVDADGIQLKSLLDKSVGSHMRFVAAAVTDNYPEMLKKCYVINVPPFAYTWYNVLKRFIDAEPIRKTTLYGRDGWQQVFLSEIDEAILPAILGGTLADPDGNKGCYTMFSDNGKVPEHHYVKSKLFNFKSEHDVNESTVPAKAFLNHEVFVLMPESIIKWSFETVDYNISFAVYYVPSDVDPMPKTGVSNLTKSFRSKARKDPKAGHIEVVPISRIDSQFFVEEGEYVCEKAGTYLLHFDNTFSWMTAKKIFYKVEVVPPRTKIIS